MQSEAGKISRQPDRDKQRVPPDRVAPVWCGRRLAARLLEALFAQVVFVGAVQVAKLVQQGLFDLADQLGRRAHGAQQVLAVQDDAARLARLVPQRQATKQTQDRRR